HKGRLYGASRREHWMTLADRTLPDRRGRGMLTIVTQDGRQADAGPAEALDPERARHRKGAARAMDVHEYQAAELLAKHGVPVKPGRVATTPAEAAEAADQLGGTVAIKAQVHTGGRGKAGGVKIAHDPDEARSAAQAILGMDIKG